MMILEKYISTQCAKDQKDRRCVGRHHLELYRHHNGSKIFLKIYNCFSRQYFQNTSLNIQNKMSANLEGILVKP